MSTLKIHAGLIGYGIQALLTPKLHMQEGKALGVDYNYELIDLKLLGLDAKALPELLENAAARGFIGLNITHPCKQAILPALDELSEEAQAIGAVNTVLFRDGKMIGHNTDWWGFAESFKRGLPAVARDEVLLLGAGGAGAALAYASFRVGVKHLLIFDVDQARVDRLVAHCNELFGSAWAAAVATLDQGISRADGLIQATPVGMNNYPGIPIAAQLLEARQWVAEIIYTPLETELLRQANEKGCRTLNGMGMTVRQAAKTFQLFTGIQPQIERMEQHFVSLQ